MKVKVSQKMFYNSTVRLRSVTQAMAWIPYYVATEKEEILMAWLLENIIEVEALAIILSVAESPYSDLREKCAGNKVARTVRDVLSISSSSLFSCASCILLSCLIPLRKRQRVEDLRERVGDLQEQITSEDPAEGEAAVILGQASSSIWVIVICLKTQPRVRPLSFAAGQLRHLGHCHIA